VIMWTVVPLESVFEGLNLAHTEPYREIRRGHLTMLVEPVQDGYGKIVRLVSPDCNDYLDPQFAPGSLIRL
jgi:hypothetical protein